MSETTGSKSLSETMFNIRLAIPFIWLDELERLRRVHHSTRLALLRRYILDGMQQDLKRLNEQVDTFDFRPSLSDIKTNPRPSHWSVRNEKL